MKNNLDRVPAMLSEGEMVMNNEASDLLGRQMLAQANKEGLKMRQQNYVNGTQQQGVQLPRLGGGLDQGNGVMGNMGVPGVMKQGNRYSQAKGFKPSLGVSKPVAQGMAPFSMPLGYVDGTTDAQGIQPGFMDTIRGIMNAGDEEPMPQQPAPQLGASAPTLEQAKGNYELQNGVKGYANGTLSPYGIPIDTYPADPNRFGFQGVPSNKQLIPSNQQRLPVSTVEPQIPPSRGVIPAGPLDNGFRPNWTYGNGQAAEPLTRVEKPGFTPGQSPEARAFTNRPAFESTSGFQATGQPAEPGFVGANKPPSLGAKLLGAANTASIIPAGFEAADQAGNLLRDNGMNTAKNDFARNAISTVLTTDQNNPLRTGFNEAARSVGNVLEDYASRFSSPANAAPQTPPALNQSPAPKPALPQLGAGNINMGQVPSRVSDTGLPYNPVGNTVNFTNPDGTGQGSISERMPVNGGLAARMNDGKGSLSVMKLESPFGPGGKPQEAQPQQAYQPSQGQDFSPGISQYMDVLDRSPDMSSLGNMIRDKKVRESAKANLGTLVGLQEQSQGNAIKRDTLGQDQNQFNSQQGLARDQFNREGDQQQFTNKLGLADIGLKQKSAQTEAKRDADKLMLDKIKAAPQAYQSMLLESLSKRLAAGQQDTPAYKEQMRLYEMAFGKRAIDDLGAMQPTQ